MKKTQIIACSLLLAGCLNGGNAIAANGPKEAVVTVDNQPTTFSIVTKTENNHTSHNIMANGNWVANADQDCNINAYKIFYDADDYCGKISKSHDSDVWHRNVVHYNSDSDAAEFIIETLATPDAVMEGTFRENDNSFYNMMLFRTTSNDMLKAATGLSLIGMTPQEVENVLGKYQHITECEDPYLLYSFYVDGGSSRLIYLYMNEGKVSEVALRNDPPGECESKCGEGWYYSKLPEGWYTKGTVTATNLNVRAEPKTGEVIAKIGSDHPEMMFAETKNTREEYLWVHIITKCDMKETHPDTIDGWVYGKYVSPSFKNFHLGTCFSNCFEYFDWLPPYLGEPTTTNATEPDENSKYQVTKTWPDKGINLTFNVFKTGATYVNSAEITGEKYAFAGLKVGANVEMIRNFDANLNKVNFKLQKSCDITGNGTMTWTSTEYDEEENSRQVVVEARNGKVIKITLNNI